VSSIRPSSAPPADPRQTWDRPLCVQFVHGLESNPSGSKAVYLDKWFDSVTPAMDTSDFEGAVKTQAAMLAERPPEVLIGSSFGGAVALALLDRGIHRGATVLLAPAHRHFGVPERIPPGIPVLIVHGTRDDVVSIEGSRALAKTGTPGLVQLVEVDDEHRLASLLVGDTLARHVRSVFAVGR
jgi:alpha-beta hydrolase superfamily lysophospholipase